MPIGFLTDADRDRLNRFPNDVAPTDLLTYFTLSEADLELIQTHRGDHQPARLRATTRCCQVPRLFA